MPSSYAERNVVLCTRQRRRKTLKDAPGITVYARETGNGSRRDRKKKWKHQGICRPEATMEISGHEPTAASPVLPDQVSRLSKKATTGRGIRRLAQVASSIKSIVPKSIVYVQNQDQVLALPSARGCHRASETP